MKNPTPSSTSKTPERGKPRSVFRLVPVARLLRPFCTPVVGITLMELMIVIAIVGILSAIGAYGYLAYVKKAEIAKAIYYIGVISSDIKIYQGDNNGELPETLDDMDRAIPDDPWGNPFQYQDVDAIPKGKRRKDKFLVPLNSDFDLWSMGPDGESRPPLTAKASRDDIIRAGDGRYIGLATGY